MTPAIATNIKCVPAVNNDSTSTSSEEERLRNFDYFKDSYDAFLKKSNQKRSKSAFKNSNLTYDNFMEIINLNENGKPVEDLERTIVRMFSFNLK